MKKSLIVTAVALSFALGVASFHIYKRFQPEKAAGPKRVWIEYSEKITQEDYEADFGRPTYAEARLQWYASQKPGCILLTRNRGLADYHVSIAVTRIMNSPTFGMATLSITRRNGDVVVSNHFYQNRDSNEDIAMQPINASWQWLCPEAKAF